jgi:leucyl-tRNA synthetase
LFDIGVVPNSEPYQKRTSHGMVLGPDGEKMSKSRGNVINPDDMVVAYGADAYRLYQMFMGPFDQAIPWDPKGIEGTSRLLYRIWKMQDKVQKGKFEESKSFITLLHKTIKKVGEDIEEMRFNTVVSALMILSNEMEKEEKISVNTYSLFAMLLAPFAPHFAEEVWTNLGNKKSIHAQPWPKFDPKKIKEDEVNLVVQVNGKFRAMIKVPTGITQKEAEDLVKKDENVSKWLENQTIKKIIFVPNKLINIVI